MSKSSEKVRFATTQLMVQLLGRKHWQQDKQTKNSMRKVPHHSEVGTIPERVPGIVT